METVISVVESWEPFFTAQLGAAATLGGLVFVGLSMNLAKILSYPALPNRALLALALLLMILIVSSLLLMPGVSLRVIGIITILLGIAISAAGTLIQLRSLRASEAQGRINYALNMVLFECSVLPYIIAGILLLRSDTAALYWVAAAIIISFAKAVVDAWVLLVEINR